MHLEILVEDTSGSKLLDHILPKIVGPQGDPHTWRLHPYKGVGRLPGGLQTREDPSKRMLLDQLPRLLRGYGRTAGIDAVVVVLDTDRRDCAAFLAELRNLTHGCNPRPQTLFRLAIEEIEAWYLGDRGALLTAYPRAKRQVLDRYVQDSICGTWELLANALVVGGVAAVKKSGWPAPGQLKHEWAEKISPQMDVEQNLSPSFAKLRNGLRSLVGL
jgi:hypothetical protein